MKLFVTSLALGAAVFSAAETSYFGIYFNNARIGYATRESRSMSYQGKPAIRTNTRWATTMTLGEAKQKSVVETVSWATLEGKPLRETTSTVTDGKKVTTDAVFGPKNVEVTYEAAGEKGQQSFPIPDGPIFHEGPIFFGTLNELGKLICSKVAPGSSLKVWSFAGNGFGPFELKGKQPTEVTIDGKKVTAGVTELSFGGSTAFKLYTSGSGEPLRMDAPSGMLFSALSKEMALAPLGKDAEQADLLASVHLQANHPLGESPSLYRLKLKVTGQDLSKIPSDEFQTVKKDGDSWIVEIHPPEMQIRMDAPLEGVAKGQEAWIKPSLYISSGDPKIKAAAGKAVEQTTRVQDAISGIRHFVQERMKYEIGFGDVRDAKEVLQKPKGKCTDYAILTAALLRAAGIPARMATGIVGDPQGGFDYHAWCEAWDGERWIGVDSLLISDQVDATYIKLASGSVEEAFGLESWDPKKVKIEVLMVQPANAAPIVYQTGK